MRAATWVIGATLGVALLATGPSAAAGIIVTEGQGADDGDGGRGAEVVDCPGDSEHELPALGGEAGGSGGTSEDGRPDDRRRGSEDDEAVTADGDASAEEKLADMDREAPSGWVCVSLGGGIEYCTKRRRAGEMPGRAESDESGGANPHDDDQPAGDYGTTRGGLKRGEPARGCHGGLPPSSPLLGLALLLAGAFVRRARRADA